MLLAEQSGKACRHEVVEADQQYRRTTRDVVDGGDRGGSAHPIDGTALDVGANERVQLQLAAEVVVQRPGGHACGACANSPTPTGG